MNSCELKDLKRALERRDELPSYQEDLIDNAIFCVDNGSEYRAEQSLRTMVTNYRNDGLDSAADMVEAVL